MKTLSLKRKYQNGNSVALGDNGDHVQVRSILKTGIIKNVGNFGQLKPETKTDGMTKIVSGDFELFVEVKDCDFLSFGSEVGLVTIKDCAMVYYQRISKD